MKIKENVAFTCPVCRVVSGNVIPWYANLTKEQKDVLIEKFKEEVKEAKCPYNV